MSHAINTVSVRSALATAAVIISLAFSSSGCGSKVVDELETLKDKMCACTERQCAIDTGKELERWSVANRAARGSRKAKERIPKLIEESNECKTRVLMTPTKKGGSGSDSAGAAKTKTDAP